MDTKITKKFTSLIRTIKPHLFGITAIFMSRVILFDTIDPVLMGFMGILCFERCFFTAILFAVIGLVTVHGKIYITRYLIAICILALFVYIASMKNIKPSSLTKSSLCGISMFMGGLLFSVSEDISVFYGVLALLEGLLSAFMCYIFDSASEILFSSKAKQTIDSEELLSLSLIICCIISGSADINTGYTPLSLYLMMVFIFLLCYKCGFSISISGSAIMGLVTVFGRIASASGIPVLIMGSIFATVLSKKHKLLTPIGFAMGAIPMAVYWQPELLTYGSLISLICAGATLLIIPDNLYLAISAPVDTGITRSLEYGTLVKEITSMRLKRFSRSFSQLSKALNRVSADKKNISSAKDAAAVVDDIVAITCSECKYNSFCWEQRFNYTYGSILDIVEVFEKNNTATIDDVPAIFKQHCSHIREMLSAINHVYEIRSINKMWQKKISQGRDMISCQISSVAELIKSLWKDLDVGLTFDNKKSKELYEELSKYPLKIKNAVIYTNSDNRTEALITLENCYSCNFCLNNVIPLVSRNLGLRMCRKYEGCHINEDNNCRLYLTESEKYRISAYGASIAKDKVCGDSYTNIHFENGKYLLALSDGMGYGSAAREESAASIELYEEFVSAGFDKKMAINMINSVLFMRSNENSFSTLDICTINLFSGICEFIKIGAVSSFIIRNGKVETVRSSTLPVGILSTVETETYTKQLMPDDIIIMVTDGVTEANNNPVRYEKWLCELLENTDITQPKALVNMILSTAKSNSVIQKDDMTVLAAKIR